MLERQNLRLKSHSIGNKEEQRTKPDIQPAFPLIQMPIFEVRPGGLKAKQIN